jgi:DNA-binding response OmpR family regulator
MRPIQKETIRSIARRRLLVSMATVARAAAIETVRGLGYRFVAPASWSSGIS